MRDDEGLHLGNKHRYAHTDWSKKRMNIKLAAQLLCESVAKSLQLCLCNDLIEFRGF